MNIARHFLKEQEREEKTVLLDKQVQPEQKQRLPHFKHWLGKCNPYLANLWRFRKRIAPGIEVRHREFARVGTQASPYMAYRKMVKKRFPEKWMTHGWMQSCPVHALCRIHNAGSSQRAVQTQPRPPHGQNRDERIDYGRRVVWYAFGTAGDIDIANINPAQEQILKFVKEVEPVERENLQTVHRQTLRMK